MSEDRFKISLRTKRKPRPAISAPQQISKGPAPQSNAPPVRSVAGKASLAVPSPGGKTSDLVKRRYSTRFNNLPAGYDATLPPPIPSVPAINGQGGRGPAVTLDVNALKNPNLRADQYVASILGNASEQDIEDYRQQLNRMRAKTSTDLQQNVYQNRTQFIKISKEAEKLKGEMRVLRNLMSELKSNVSALRSASSAPDQQTSKRDKRSSIADRTQIWNSHLQEMWKQIAGSQKFLPAAPGRHVIQDAGNWFELDPATWKPRREMRLFLLNDHLLVASRKKPSAEDRGARGTPEAARERLVADRCWPLLDIEMVDLANTNNVSGSRSNVSNAIMVKSVGLDSFTYQVENPRSNEKATLLLNFRRSAEELRKGVKADLVEAVSEIKDRPDMLIEVDGKQQNMRWVEGQIDELDIDIALQRFEKAVARVEQLKGLAKDLRSNALAQDFINLKADEGALKLAELVNHELVETHNELAKTKRNVDWLSRLGFDNRARESYLDARSQLIRKRSRQCIFDGNLQQYIWELSFVYFTMIKNTVNTFQACFPKIMTSACVKWAKEQVDAFNDILLRQLSNTDPGEKTWIETMNQARDHAKMLSEVGLDFDHLIGKKKVIEPVVQSTLELPK